MTFEVTIVPSQSKLSSVAHVGSLQVHVHDRLDLLQLLPGTLIFAFSDRIRSLLFCAR